MHDFERDYRFAEDAQDDEPCCRSERRTFEGYPAPIPARPERATTSACSPRVNCSASVARFVAEAVERRASWRIIRTSTASSPSSTAPAAAMRHKGEGVRRAASARNGATPAIRTSPASSWSGSAARCFQIGRMKKEYGLQETDTFRTMTIQETGGTRKTVEAIVGRSEGVCCRSPRRAKRETRPASETRAGAAMRRLGRLFGPDRQPGARRRIRPPRAARAARRSCPKRRRSMAPSTCSPAAPPRARWARSSSSGSVGGRTTRRAAAAR